jgi:glycosyltransferase involved in cell wall biosynthesis
MIRILYDHQTFSTQRYGGISRYFFNLYKGLGAFSDINSSIAALYSENEYLKNSPVLLNNALGKTIFAGHNNRIYRWNRRYSSLKIRQGKFDVFHPTYYDPYFIPDLKKPFVLTVHDMIHELMADRFTDNNQVIAQKKLLIEKADAVIAISHYTKSEILKFYPEAADKITVIHHGYQFNAARLAGALTLPPKYILFVGERYFYKNFVSSVKAIACLLNADPDLHLICAGGGGFTAEESALFDSLNINAQCRQISATDGELQQLYQQARVFIFPSLIEGFGFPLLEAFTGGCPVAASNNSCFPEIGGDAVMYFDPLDEGSMRTAVETLLNDEALRQGQIDKGSERLKLFTIEKQVAETLDLYRQIHPL